MVSSSISSHLSVVALYFVVLTNSTSSDWDNGNLDEQWKLKYDNGMTMCLNDYNMKKKIDNIRKNVTNKVTM